MNFLPSFFGGGKRKSGDQNRIKRRFDETFDDIEEEDMAISLFLCRDKFALPRHRRSAVRFADLESPFSCDVLE